MKQKKKFSWTRLGFRWLGRLIVLIILVFALLQTDGVQDRITRWLAQKLSGERMQVELTQLRGFWPFHPTLASARLYDAEGLWLELSDLSLNWQYKKGSIIIPELRIQHLDVKRIPHLAQQTNGTEAEAAFSVSNLPGIDLRHFSITTFDWHAGIGTIEDGGPLTLSLQMPRGSGKVDIQADMMQSSGEARMQLAVDLEKIAADGKLDVRLHPQHKITADFHYADDQLQLEAVADTPDLSDLLRRTGQFLGNDPMLRWLPDANDSPLSVKIQTRLNLDAQTLAVHSQVDFPGGHADLPVEWDRASGQLHLSVASDLAELLPISTWAGYPVKGAGRGTVDFALKPRSQDGWRMTVALERELGDRIQSVQSVVELTTQAGGWDLQAKELSLAAPLFLLTIKEPLTLQNRGERFILPLSNLYLNGTALHLQASLQDDDIQVQVQMPEIMLDEITVPDALPLKGNSQPGLLNHLAWFAEQQIIGKLSADLSYRRQAGVPSWAGVLKLKEGRYEHYQLGTRLDALEVDLRLEDNKVVLRSARAQTPGGGTLQGSGTLDLSEKNRSGEVTLELRKARLLHLDPVQAALSGTVKLRHQQGGMIEASGALVLEETVFHLDRLPSSTPSPLPFTILGAEKPLIEKPSAPKAVKKQWGTGELTLNIPGRLTVEAKNVYSVWEGQFKIAFRPLGIYLLGKLTPRRGNVIFFGRNFTLSSGNVHFTDLITVPPILDLVALYSRKDMDARLKITGIATHPTFRLESSPPMPQDEIISRILFGKDMSTITGLQALEVGMALRGMMDKKGNANWDVMGKAKDWLGVDQLELRESGDITGSTELVAGRQINNRLYLEFNQRLHEPGSTIMFEYEIRRNLSISTETGTHTLPGLGVNWKRDY